jgi:hypothetical protein
MTTSEQPKVVSLMAWSTSSGSAAGRATTDGQIGFHSDSNGRIGSSRTGWRSPRNASSDTAARRTAMTPSYNRVERS